MRAVLHQYFANNDGLPDDDARKVQHRRYGLTAAASERAWEQYEPRFNIAQNPNEPFRFGWMVEIDPYQPGFIPQKRTALGRFKHEAASIVIAPDGRAVVYMGDDERFDYVYKFVSEGRVDTSDRTANNGLLDRGTLYVARYDDDGSGTWIPLTWSETGLLSPERGFASQADVLIRVRQAGDAVGATKMDRPEDVEVNPVTAKVYAAMTNNTNRGAEGQAPPDRANPRARNAWGHILEMTENGGDHAALGFRWEVFLLAGDPADASTYFAGFDKSQVSAIGNPDNIAFDARGNLWIATDGQPSSLRINDGIYGVATEGPQRGQVKQLMSAVVGAEVASLVIGPGSQALFTTIQHPGEGGNLAQPTSTWPDGPGSVARPSVVVITREDGRPIGA